MLQNWNVMRFFLWNLVIVYAEKRQIMVILILFFHLHLENRPTRGHFRPIVVIFLQKTDQTHHFSDQLWLLYYRKPTNNIYWRSVLTCKKNKNLNTENRPFATYFRPNSYTEHRNPTKSNRFPTKLINWS